MLFLTATAIGVSAGMMRSAVAVAAVAVMIVCTFIAASLLSIGPWAFGKLLIAVLGYNFGVVALLTTMVIAARRRHA